MNQKFFSEFLGTALLLMIIVGSGIMGDNLSRGNEAIALLANSIATGAGLYFLILCFGESSGAHFNPVVSMVEFWWGRISFSDFIKYMSSQMLGSIVGVLCAHVMFGLSLFQLSGKNRFEFRFIFSELIATFGLILVISLSGRKRVDATPAAVSLYVVAAYWFTSSTSFANPAVTIARSLTNTFTGIHWMGTPGFVLAQIAGALIASRISKHLIQRNCSTTDKSDF